MSGRRWAVVVVAGLAVVIGLLWLTHGERSDAERTATTRDVSGVRVEPTGTGLATGTPAWNGLRGRRIAGVVVDGDGRPLPAATVRLTSVYIGAGIVAGASRTTDEAGRFDLGAHAATEYVVTAEAPKRTAAVERLELRDPTSDSEHLVLVVHSCDASVHGTILDSTGGPIAGALVARIDENVPTQAGVEADAQGAYELCVPPGHAALVVSADGYASARVAVASYGRLRHDVRLVPGAVVSGRVVRAGDRTPIAGALVHVTSAIPTADAVAHRITTDADGRFHTTALSPGRYVVHADHDRLAMRVPIDVLAEVGVAASDIICELEPAMRVAGRVVAATSGRPIAGRTVHLYSRMRPDAPPLDGVSQADGTFVIDRVLPAEYVAIATFQGAFSAKLEVTDQDVTGLTIEVPDAASISGRILAGGKPVEGAAVRIENRAMTTSKADGSFTLDGLAAGTYAVYAESHRIGAFTHGPSVTVADGEQKTGIDVTLDLAGSIEGVVVDQEGAPVAGVFVGFSLLGKRDFGAATTGDDGTFRVRALSGGGDYLYEVRAYEGSGLVYPPVKGRRHPPVAVRDGSSRVTGLRIQVRFERLTIAGRVLDGANKPIADARVTVSQAGRYWGDSATVSDERGAFVFRDVPQGSYEITVVTARGEARIENVVAGRRDVVIQIPDPGGIDGTLEGFSGSVEVTVVGVDRYGRYRTTTTTPTFALRALPPGRYQVTAQAASKRGRVFVDVAAGTIATVRIAADQHGSIVGTLVDAATGAAIAGATCSAMPDSVEFDERPQTTSTDATGAFRFDRVAAGLTMVYCKGKSSHTSQDVTVTAGQAARMELRAEKRKAREETRRPSGLTLETHFSDVIVRGVAADSPAARAKIAVGDVIVRIEEDEIDGMPGEAVLRLIEIHADPDKPIAIGIERDDAKLTVSLKLDPAP